MDPAVLEGETEPLSSALCRRAQALTGKERLDFLGELLKCLANYGVFDPRMRVPCAELARSFGLHILPVNFYSPVPHVELLPGSLWEGRLDERLDLRLNPDSQLELLRRLVPRTEELFDVPYEEVSPAEFYWDNPCFGGLDAAAYYALIRELRPRRIVEVGAGYSTLLALRAAAGSGARVTAIDPFPTEFLARGLPGLEMISEAVQGAPEKLFSDLEAGDILFIDGSHVSATGSDLNHLLFRVIPSLAPGVLVHFHDIFLPWEYPRDWMGTNGLFFNEQYLILAMLAFGERFEVLLANQLLWRERREALRAMFPHLPRLDGASLWLKCSPRGRR